MTRERFAETLRDYSADHQWVQMLGWSDEDLQSVQIHEQATSGDEMINLANFGGTPQGVSANAGGPTSANARAIRNVWVYKRTTPEGLWQQLKDLEQRGGPSGYNESGEFGQTGEATFPPGTSNGGGSNRGTSGGTNGGSQRTERPGHTGVYPASGPLPPDNAPVRSQAEWGQGERGAAGYEDHGESEPTLPKRNQT